MAPGGEGKPNTGGGSGGAKGGGRKRKFLPHGKPVRKGAYPLRPGVQGFFITCDGGRERQATREALSLLDSVSCPPTIPLLRACHWPPCSVAVPCDCALARCSSNFPRLPGLVEGGVSRSGLVAGFTGDEFVLSINPIAYHQVCGRKHHAVLGVAVATHIACFSVHLFD